MPNNEELYLVLGCFGRKDDNFISCSGLENKILKVIFTLENYNKIMDYLENCRLFDKPLFDVNGVRNVIFYMQDKFDQGMKRLWSEKEFLLYQKFLLGHKECGTYLKLSLINKEFEEPAEKEPERIFIKGGPQLGVKRSGR